MEIKILSTTKIIYNCKELITYHVFFYEIWLIFVDFGTGNGNSQPNKKTRCSKTVGLSMSGKYCPWIIMLLLKFIKMRKLTSQQDDEYANYLESFLKDKDEWNFLKIDELHKIISYLLNLSKFSTSFLCNTLFLLYKFLFRSCISNGINNTFQTTCDFLLLKPCVWRFFSSILKS